ncbi:MAG: hypothetical protein QNJ65_00460 [Xenococcaceae cyanobacterium MO_234.B1]|nr:hypothetical protein [Xenococcaceae cyanobacterium MO_234.B1]
MYQSPNNFDFEPNDDLNHHSSTQELIDGNDLDNLSKKQIIQRKKQLEKLFIYLIGFGVGLGLVLALIITITLNKFGLLKKPYEIESQPQQTETLELEGVEIQ